jgi:hypothetical protein
MTNMSFSILVTGLRLHATFAGFFNMCYKHDQENLAINKQQIKNVVVISERELNNAEYSTAGNSRIATCRQGLHPE